jgi:prepilin-type N-terminal cleavage/methylation domain-containing protein
MIPAQEKVPQAGLRRPGSRRGFTLVETMVATVLLSVMILSILQVLIGAYRLSAKARYNDHARYIVKSFADQFLTQQSTYITGATIPFFVPTSATGLGLSWTATAPGGITQTTYTGTASGLVVPLSDSATGETPVVGNVTRQVWCLDPSTGLPETPATTVAGALLRGDFTITFPMGGRTISQTISVVRATP